MARRRVQWLEEEGAGAYTARTGRRRPKGAATKAAQDARAPEMLLHYKVEAMAPALTDRRLCQTAAYTAALPTVRRLCQTKAALPDLGTKDPAHSEGGGFANIWRRLCKGDHRGATPLFEDASGLCRFGAWVCPGGNGDLVCPSPRLVTQRPPTALVPCCTCS